MGAEDGHTESCQAILACKEFTEVNAKSIYTLHPRMFMQELTELNELNKVFSEAMAKQTDGWTALHLAARYGHTEACQAILASKKFTEVNAKDHDGRTALHFAASY